MGDFDRGGVLVMVKPMPLKLSSVVTVRLRGLMPGKQEDIAGATFWSSTHSQSSDHQRYPPSTSCNDICGEHGRLAAGCVSRVQYESVEKGVNSASLFGMPRGVYFLFHFGVVMEVLSGDPHCEC
eukprot:8787444-Ditylum_brightwellii.AAC.1